ncbi:MAG: ABC transporter ATP-binding protein [Butyrivibrio sp.]
MYTVEAKNICKEYKGETVLKNVNFTLEPGQITGITGRNGTGKSIFLKMVAGLIIPDSGDILINGVKLKKGQYPQDIGVLLDCTGFLPEYSAIENLLSIASIRKIAGKYEIEEIIERVGLDPKSGKAYKKFSLGMKQKLAIAQAFMEKPQILLLDEPMNSLDEESVQDIRALILSYVKENQASAIITSHYSEDIKALCSKVYEIKNKTFNCL